MITQILNNPRSEFFFSFLIGVGMVIMLFHRPYITERSLAVDPSTLEDHTVKANGKCYKYRAEDTTCKNKRSK
jgi:hypothetical protein